MNRIKWLNTVRAFGLLLVLVYHLFYNLLPGGFLGVDIFFTFSGFLITAQFVGEFRKKGGIDLFRFYKRRVSRIMIPMFLMVVFTLPFALLISPDFTVGIAKQLASVLSFTINWFYIFTGLSYEAQLIPSMYSHTWSLAVIMQYYLLWGLACALSAVLSNAIFNKDNVKRYRCFKAIVLTVSGIAAVLSFMHMRVSYNAGHNLDAIYFNTLSRLYPFFIGSFAAAVWGMQDKQDAVVKPLLSGKYAKAYAALFIAIILSAVLFIVLSLSQRTFDDSFIFRYGFLFASVITVALIYCAHGLHILTPPWLNEPKPLTALADISYDLFLYHWPFYVVFSALIINNTAASFTALAISLIFSIIMVCCVERVLIPQNSTGRIRHKRIIAVVTGLSAICAACAGWVIVSKAPVITSIEEDFAASYITSGARGIMSLKRGIDAINIMPVDYAVSNTPLQANLLPAATATPEPASTPVPTAAPSEKPAQTSLPAITPPPPLTVNVTGGITIIGDSVTVGAQPALLNTLPYCYIDAVVGRPVSAGLGILADLQDSGSLGEYVVIALGTNGTDSYERLLTQIIDALNPGHKLIFVTPFDGRENANARMANATAAWMREQPAIYGFITVADWTALIEPIADILAKDRVHIAGQASQQFFANCVAQAINTASSKPAKQ